MCTYGCKQLKLFLFVMSLYMSFTFFFITSSTKLGQFLWCSDLLTCIPVLCYPVLSSWLPQPLIFIETSLLNVGRFLDKVLSTVKWASLSCNFNLLLCFESLAKESFMQNSVCIFNQSLWAHHHNDLKYEVVFEQLCLSLVLNIFTGFKCVFFPPPFPLSYSSLSTSIFFCSLTDVF